ncbi:LysR family transcriptional regulator [Scandinavium sp. V105_16]|uniref:LysR family transcriptional regulator n=1 Tax=Scandinavium lactucae TaxID=3095028 RepID=A0AAJ2VW88_9ENTR|nr:MULTISPECIES: LysR family transcriptional regulator [unclassified Scandinavium]MDX6022290.1 LysR family transcriptional regulator [Scandinavium sp. V105_16]MDX6033868.1 LysR family transcriptional regulator [Scandinavium sp. V105_12]
MTKRQSLTGQPGSIAKLDLNLITLFELVYRHKSVAKAADVMDVTASAVSQGLNRLRAHFDDPLFVRNGSRLESTAFAENVHRSIADSFEDVLTQLQSLSPTVAQSQLNIICPPYLSLFIFKPLVRIVAEISPQCKILHTPDDNLEETTDKALTFRKADIIFDLQPHNMHSRISHLLYNEELVFIRAKNHPRISGFAPSDQLSKEQFTVLNSNKFSVANVQDEINARINAVRDIRFRSGSTFSIIAMVSASDTIGVVSRNLAEMFSDTFDIGIVETDISIPAVPVYMVYNKFSLKNPLMKNIVDRMVEEFT